MVNVRYPYERHGLGGKTSNSAKVGVFILFVDAVGKVKFMYKRFGF